MPESIYKQLESQRVRSDVQVHHPNIRHQIILIMAQRTYLQQMSHDSARDLSKDVQESFDTSDVASDERGQGDRLHAKSGFIQGFLLTPAARH